jgi:Tfp pilus assembly protein PilX
MNSMTNNNQTGIVLVVVLMLLTVFSILGVTFTLYASQTQCSKNPTVESRDGRCIKDIGPDR